MRRMALLIGALALFSSPAFGRGMLIPEDAKLQPLAMVNHRVNVAMEDQVAVTTVEQTFRNHTDRNLEGTFIFPVPRGASVNKFTMWVDGKETQGELLDAKKANQIYTDIVRRTQDPGLLEYMGNGMMRMRVFPIPPKGDQKVKLSFTSVATREAGVVEYLYPLKTDGKETRTLEEFSVKISIVSQAPIQSIYSPTHAIDIKRDGDKKATVEFQKNQALLDKDFQLFYSLGKKEIGLTPLLYRPVSSEDGYLMLLVSPQTETTMNRLPRDLVLVLDTSGSMSDLKMSQAKNALKHCLRQLAAKDRFAVVSFATAVRTYRDTLTEASSEQLEKAEKWVDDLRAGGGTAIKPALDAAIDFRTRDVGRPFNVVFFTDGQPTVDERDPVKIVKEIAAKNSSQTRIFTFGVGDDVNAAMLDQLADATRASTTYVRPAEDIEVKAAALSTRISHPVMTNVKLTTTNVKLHEYYPNQLPDLFHGSQLVLFGRYTGSGHSLIKLTGQVGNEEKVLEYEVDFPAKTEAGREFVEAIWARRKVGFLLDQIRINGEQKELVDEVTMLAKRYGIATPYTSYLVVPDGPMPIISQPGRLMPQFDANALPPGLTAGAGTGPINVNRFAKEQAEAADKATPNAPAAGVAANRTELQDRLLRDELEKMTADQKKDAYAKNLDRARRAQDDLVAGYQNFRGGKLKENQVGRLAVDLAQCSQNLRGQERLSQTANKVLNGRNCIEIGGVWVDDKFDAKTQVVTVKALSPAYFRILEKQPAMKDVFRTGKHLVWITPSGTALIIDTNDGVSDLKDAEIDALFIAKK